MDFGGENAGRQSVWFTFSDENGSTPLTRTKSYSDRFVVNCDQGVLNLSSVGVMLVPNSDNRASITMEVREALSERKVGEANRKVELGHNIISEINFANPLRIVSGRTYVVISQISEGVTVEWQPFHRVNNTLQKTAAGVTAHCLPSDYIAWGLRIERL